MVHHLSTVEVERLLAGEREGRRLYRWTLQVENLREQLGNEKSDESFHHTDKLGPRRNRGRRRAGERVWQRAFKSRWGQRVDPRARSTRCLLQLPAMNTMSLRPKKCLTTSKQEERVSRKNQLWIWCRCVLKKSYDKYVRCVPAITSYENDVVVSQQHVHIALSQDVSMISKNRRKLLRQF